MKSRMEWVEKLMSEEEEPFTKCLKLLEIVGQIQQEIWDAARSKYLSKIHPFKGILRPDSNGEPDDIFIECDNIHLERMDHHWFWMGVYRGNKRVTFSIGAGIHKDNPGDPIEVTVRVDEDMIGLIDDTNKDKS